MAKHPTFVLDASRVLIPTSAMREWCHYSGSGSGSGSGPGSLMMRSQKRTISIVLLEITGVLSLRRD